MTFIKKYLGQTQRVKIEVLEKKSWSSLLKLISEIGNPSWNAPTTKLRWLIPSSGVFKQQM